MLTPFFQNHAQYCTKRLARENQCSPEDAEDIFIESVMNLREKLIQGAVDAISNVRSYLFQTCHHMLLDRIRKTERMDKAADDVARFFYESTYSEEGSSFDPELLEITRRSWKELSEKCKDILHYFYVDRLDMKEIAELMTFSNANVAKTSKSRCFKHFSQRAFEMRQMKSAKLT